MADPQTGIATQIRNIEAKTGKSFAQLRQLVAQSGHAKVGELRKWLMDTLALGYGDANMLALRATEENRSAASDADPLDAIYAGNKASLRPLHDLLGSAIDQLGPYEKAPKKAYVSMRRKKQFAMLGPATRDALELGLNVKQLPASPRLKAMAPGGMCPYTVRLSAAAEVDAELLAWVRAAYDAAG